MKGQEPAIKAWKSFVVSAMGIAGIALSSGCLVDAQLNSTNGGNSKSSAAKNGTSTSSSETKQGTTGGSEPAPGGEDCGNLEETVCLQRVPIDWYGPIQPQRTSKLEDLTPCDSPGLKFDSVGNPSKQIAGDEAQTRPSALPDAGSNIFVDSMTGDPASCSSVCTSRLDIGACAPMTFIMKKFDPATGKCGDMILDAPAPVIANTCEHLDPRWLPSNDMAIGAIPPQPMQGEAICEAGGDVTADVPPPKVGQYYRVCAGQEEYQGECPTGQVCTRFQNRDNRNRAAMGCIYRKGDVACPSGDYNGFRVLLYGDAVDERGCTECQVKHEKGTLDCHYDIKMAMNSPDANCDGGESTRSEDICLSQKDIANDANGPAAVQGTYLELKYSGNCSAKEAEPQGEIKLGEPITLCCADF